VSLESGLSLCSLCPRLCRHVCPVATGTAREAAVPALIAATLIDWQRGRASSALAEQASTLCTDCGACEALCHLHRPLPRLLRESRARLLPPPPMEPLRAIEGVGPDLVIETDERPFAAAVARRLGAPVARLATADRLGVQGVEHSQFPERAVALRALLAGFRVLVADGGVARVLQAADVPFDWLHERFSDLAGTASCLAPGNAGPMACCGAGGPLPVHQPEAAVQVAVAWWKRGPTPNVSDARCREHLRRCGFDTRDAIDRLLDSTPSGTPDASDRS
jgi:hypothetical protein